jgi:flagellar assembly factor FliW
MVYDVKVDILGFEDTKKVTIHEIDELFYTMKDVDNEHISFTLVNPYLLREYSFDVPSDVKVLLELNADSNAKVYNTVMIKTPLEESTIDFLSPIIVNTDNNKLGQVILKKQRHPDFGMCEKIKSFIK